jgi:antitoxin (DNA-binding transcriptional repressor) of toxin-antitoxin stability system
MAAFTVGQARRQFSKLIDRALDGERMVIVHDGREAELTPHPDALRRRAAESDKPAAN